MVPKLKKSATSAISSAVSAALGISIMVPMGMFSLPMYFFCFFTFAIVCSVCSRSMASSERVPTSGIMISGLASIFFLLHWIIASTIARTCMARISG